MKKIIKILIKTTLVSLVALILCVAISPMEIKLVTYVITWFVSLIIISNKILTKHINWKYANLALWIEIIISWFFPFHVSKGFEYSIGFPIPFFTLYDTEYGTNLFLSSLLNPFAFLIDSFIIYLLIFGVMKVVSHFKDGSLDHCIHKENSVSNLESKI